MRPANTFALSFARIVAFLVWLALRCYVAVKRAPSCTFTDPTTGAPHLTRWWLGARDAWPDADGRTGGAGWYLHKFHRSDWSRQLHNHPSRYAVAFVLRGGYREQRREEANASVEWLEHPPGTINVLTAETFHRVVLHGCVRMVGARLTYERASWSLFYIGPRSGRGWGFIREDGGTDRAAHFDGRDGTLHERAEKKEEIAAVRLARSGIDPCPSCKGGGSVYDGFADQIVDCPECTP